MRPSRIIVKSEVKCISGGCYTGTERTFNAGSIIALVTV
jgi:hypothetical protein